MTPRDTTRWRFVKTKTQVDAAEETAKPDDRDVVQRVTPQDTTRWKFVKTKTQVDAAEETAKRITEMLSKKANRPEREAEALLEGMRALHLEN